MPTPVKNSGLQVLARMENLEETLTWALAYLGCTRKLVEKPAVVLDIDGTVLNIRREADGRSKTTCVDWFGPFVGACVGAKITIFVVTARPDFPENRKWSETQLKNCKLWDHVEHMYMRPSHENTGTFKFKSRGAIRQRGYGILLSIGDQFLDLARKQPHNLDNHEWLVGTLGDDGSYAIKLPSEFGKGETPTPATQTTIRENDTDIDDFV